MIRVRSKLGNVKCLGGGESEVVTCKCVEHAWSG